MSTTTVRPTVLFGLGTCVLVIAAHWVAYLTHEYSHSFTAWALGWMSDPLALDYGDPTLYNILFLGDVGDNVQYDPIFAAGHGMAASSIALAGVVIGNGLLYALLYRLSKLRSIASNRVPLAMVYWLALMCAGNVWGYVPIRAITTHADIALAAKGFGISNWALFPALIVPALYVVCHFFWKMVPHCLQTITGGHGAKLALVIALSAYWFFAFYGGDGTSGNYGLVSQLLAITSKYFLFPLSVMVLASRYFRPSSAP